MVLQGDRRVVIRCQGLGAGWEDPQMSPRVESDSLEALFELDTVDLICPCLWGPIALAGPRRQAPRRAGPASGGLSNLAPALHSSQFSPQLLRVLPQSAFSTSPSALGLINRKL